VGFVFLEGRVTKKTNKVSEKTRDGSNTKALLVEFYVLSCCGFFWDDWEIAKMEQKTVFEMIRHYSDQSKNQYSQMFGKSTKWSTILFATCLVR
jgi:hypothetical protein